MSLIKLAKDKTFREIDDDYEDLRPYWRRAKGKTMGYGIGPFLGPVGLGIGAFLGHSHDRHIKEVDFKRHPKLFKKIRD